MKYHLIPGCKGPKGETMALAVDKNHPQGNLIIMALNPADKAQIFDVSFSITGTATGVVLINEMSGLAAYAPSNREPVTQIAVTSVDARSTWTLASNNPTKNAIRPFADSNMNLNVKGNGPYPDGTSVLIWNWGSGAANEVWTFMPAK